MKVQTLQGADAIECQLFWFEDVMYKGENDEK